MGAGAAMLIFSFFDFGLKQNAWGSFFRPIATLIVFYGVIMAAQIALVKFTTVEVPARLGSFTWEQIHLLLSGFALLMSLGWLVSGLDQKGIGFWVILLGSVVLVVGAVLLQRERNTGALG